MHLIEPELRESLHAAARDKEWAEAMYNSCTPDTEEVYFYRYMAAKAQLDLLIRKARRVNEYKEAFKSAKMRA